MSRDDLRERINALEALESVMSAIDDLSSSELVPGALVNAALSENKHMGLGICTAHGIPHEIVLVGLRAMRQELFALAKQPLEVA